jgi:hypothetical protein
VQQFQSLWRHLGGHLSYGCGVATWTVKAGHETELVWVVAHFKHDRNRRCRRFPALLRGQPQRPRNNNHKQHYKNQNFH